MTAIDDKWAQLGGATGTLGKSKHDEVDAATDGWTFREFDKGAIYSDGGAAFALYGKIYTRWIAAGGESFGLPVSSEQVTPVKRGRWNCFWWDRAIVWRPGVGTFVVTGWIASKWKQVGSMYSPLGAPLGDEAPFDSGMRQDFTGGSIISDSASGAYVMYPAILKHWESLGGPASTLGWPISDEIRHEDRVRRLSRFRGGTLVWSPSTGAQLQP